MSNIPPNALQDLLTFWFGADAAELQKARAADIAKAQAALWWGKDEAVDRDIAARFGELPERAQKALPVFMAHLADDTSLTNAQSLPNDMPPARYALALILALDQVPRNIHRDTPRAFAYDADACRLAKFMLAKGFDKALLPIERVFVLLPLEHSEHLADQEQLLAEFEVLLKEVRAENNTDDIAAFEDFMDYAKAHHRIIAKFGRFPHRNSILGRTSTSEEIAFLQTPNSSF